MTTIDKLDMSVYNLYAVRQRLIEEIDGELRLKEAVTIPPQTQVLDIYPKLSEVDILLGIVPYHTPWAYFYPPRRFRSMRRSPFASYRIAPTLGSLEEQEETEAALEDVVCKSPEEKKEKAIIQACFKQINEINDWLGFILGRIGQFLQG